MEQVLTSCFLKAATPYLTPHGNKQQVRAWHLCLHLVSFDLDNGTQAVTVLNLLFSGIPGRARSCRPDGFLLSSWRQDYISKQKWSSCRDQICLPKSQLQYGLFQASLYNQNLDKVPPGHILIREVSLFISFLRAKFMWSFLLPF